MTKLAELHRFRRDRRGGVELVFLSLDEARDSVDEKGNMVQQIISRKYAIVVQRHAGADSIQPACNYLPPIGAQLIREQGAEGCRRLLYNFTHRFVRNLHSRQAPSGELPEAAACSRNLPTVVMLVQSSRSLRPRSIAGMPCTRSPAP